MEILLWIYFSGMGIFWYVFYLYVARMSRRLPQLTKVAGAKQNLAKLSVIVTAKDEAHTIEKALQTLLEQDYPDFEVIIVNDRSTDDTGKIIDRFSKTHPKIVPLHIDHLPDDWIGKVHALHTAVQHASGEWLLFTDADVHHHPTLWQRAIQYAQSRSLKHLALMPSVPTDGRLLQACVRAFGFMFLSTAKIAQIENPNSKAAIGIGAFNLVRHDALKNSPGFEWLRMEVVDDYGIGIMLKAAGYKIGFATALDD